jgi:hypothetical protein
MRISPYSAMVFKPMALGEITEGRETVIYFMQQGTL